jgi:membrane fusion protein
MDRLPLFRQAAIDAQQQKLLGEIVLVRPLSYTLATTVLFGAAVAFILFACFASYTNRTTVGGHLVPDLGVVKVFPQQTSVVLEKRVAEGQRVKRGDVLYVLTADRQVSTQGNTQAAISRQVASRQQSLREEIGKTRELQHDERAALQTKIASLEAELRNLEQQSKSQHERVVLAEETLARFRDLYAQHIVSAEHFQQKELDLIDQHTRVQSIERDQITTRRNLAELQAAMVNLPLQHQNQLAQIERNLTSTSQELTESEAKRSLLVLAPESGVVSQMAAEVGQTVDGAHPLISLVPDGAKLQAVLYAPSRAVGFVKPGDAVLLRYEAFPYQKFGHARGKVSAVSLTAAPLAEISEFTGGAGAPAQGEALYKITVELAAQAVVAHGHPQALQSGMALDADILQEKRRLYEWVLEPLYSLTGKL